MSILVLSPFERNVGWLVQTYIYQQGQTCSSVDTHSKPSLYLIRCILKTRLASLNSEKSRKQRNILNGSVSFIPQYYSSLTSTGGTDHWEMIKLFTLPLYSFPFSQSAQTSEAIVCLLFSHVFQISDFQMDPRWFNRNSWDFPTISPQYFSQEIGFIGLHSGVHNKCVFYSDFPIFWAW